MGRQMGSEPFSRDTALKPKPDFPLSDGLRSTYLLETPRGKAARFFWGGKPYPAAYARFFITPLPKHFRDPFPPFSHHKGGTIFLTPILLFD